MIKIVSIIILTVIIIIWGNYRQEKLLEAGQKYEACIQEQYGMTPFACESYYKSFCKCK